MADCITSSNPLREHQRTGQSIARRNSLEFLKSFASYRLHRRPRSPRANFSAHGPMMITGRRVVPLREMLIMPSVFCRAGKVAGESGFCGLSWCRSTGASAWASPARRPVSGKVGTGLVPADRLRVWAAGYRALWGVGSRQPSDVDYPLASPGQARRVLTERSGPPGIEARRRSHKYRGMVLETPPRPIRLN